MYLAKGSLLHIFIKCSWSNNLNFELCNSSSKNKIHLLLKALKKCFKQLNRYFVLFMFAHSEIVIVAAKKLVCIFPVRQSPQMNTDAKFS